jgi:hypothetical protein
MEILDSKNASSFFHSTDAPFPVEFEFAKKTLYPGEKISNTALVDMVYHQVLESLAKHESLIDEEIAFNLMDIYRRITNDLEASVE